MERILILMTEAGGGGHFASAEALRDAFQEHCRDACSVEMLDIWSHYAPPPLSRVPASYRMLVDDLPWLYRLIYEAGERQEVTEPLMAAAARVLRIPVVRAIRRYEPSLIVSVHPLVQQIVIRVLRRLRAEMPFVTVVTDLVTIPPVWYSREVDLCFVPSEEAYDQGLRAGLDARQLRLCGLPIRSGFGKAPRPKAELRRELGFDADLPAALMVGGGEGMGQMAEVAKAIAAQLGGVSRRGQPPVGQLAVVCGRNQELMDDLKSYAWPIPVCIVGYASNIWDWMAASDLIVTKAGPGTIAEACALGLPMILTGYIPGQEAGNVPYVLRHGCGVYVEDPVQIATVVAGWLGPQRATMDQAASSARRLGRPRAAFDIAGTIAGMLPREGDHSSPKASG
jgi:1,2-diacylglycerol 3-beta-galactosyltransferase